MKYLKKMPKIWRKKFENEELLQIQKVFGNVIPAFNVDPNLGFHKMVSLYGNFPHPETDESDNSVGIEPKSVRKFLKTASIAELEIRILSCLISFIKKGSPRDAEGFYDWDNEFNNVNVSTIHIAGNDEELKASWAKLRMAPKSYSLFNSNTALFDARVLKKILSVAKVSNLTELSESDQFYAVALMNRFGKLLLNCESDKIMNHGFCPETWTVSEMLDENIASALNVLSFAALSKNADAFANIPVETVASLSNIAESNPNLMSDYAEAYVKLNPDEKVFFETFTPRNLKYLHRYNRSITDRVIIGLKSIYDNRSTEGLETMSGVVNSYTWELLPKDSNEGLFLGYATDCCQVFNGVGHSCLEDGYKEKEGGFFVVRKKGKIYAQSYVFEGIDNEGLKFFVFDSIEVVGNDLKAMKGVMDSYLQASELLIGNGGYSYVLCGADGATIPEGLEDFSSGFISYHTATSAGVYALSSYTDIKKGLFTLAGEPSFDCGESYDSYADEEDDYDDDYDYDEDEDDDYDEDHIEDGN